MLTRLHVQDVRNLEDVRLSGLSSVNVFYGVNGSGKTSVLEALHMLSTARSFRSIQARPVIRQGCESLLVFGELSSDRGKLRLGIRRGARGRPEIHIDGQPAQSISDLAQALPLQVINSESFGLIEGAPSTRRHWLDWVMFHVEPQFHDIWRSATRVLKQRNALIRHGRIDRFELDLWDREYGRLGAELAEMRERHFPRLREQVGWALALLNGPSGLVSVDMDLHRGWPTELTLDEQLASTRDKDLAAGHTRYGPHRADVRVRCHGQAAGDVLSRGQIKVLVCAMKLAQVQVVREMTGRFSTVLVDDLAAELDVEHRKSLCHALVGLDSQVFLSAVQRSDLEGMWPEDQAVSWFHVEHGRVREEMAQSPERKQ